MISLEPGIKAYTGWHHLVLEVAPPGIREDTGGHHLALVGSTGHHLALVGGSGHHLALVGRGRVVAAPIAVTAGIITNASTTSVHWWWL